MRHDLVCYVSVPSSAAGNPELSGHVVRRSVERSLVQSEPGNSEISEVIGETPKFLAGSVRTAEDKGSASASAYQWLRLGMHARRLLYARLVCM